MEWAMLSGMNIYLMGGRKEKDLGAIEWKRGTTITKIAACPRKASTTGVGM